MGICAFQGSLETTDQKKRVEKKIISEAQIAFVSLLLEE
jgi:hypothetical protein